MDQRVYLHVGLPKSGTTFLQASLTQNRVALREAGVLYPSAEQGMFLAAVDVRGNHKAWGRSRSEVKGSWDALCHRARRHDGSTVISQELLGAASERRIAAAMTMLRDLEVHVVVTARDPARQAAAEWQEGVRHGRRLTFDEFREQVLDDSSDTDYARRYRAAQDLPGVLARWADAVPAERVHVLTGPPRGAPDELLWRRFAALVGFEPAAFAPVGPELANRSLGTDEVDLLRRVNLALDNRIVQPHYSAVVKQGYARTLRDVGRSAGPVVPPEVYDDLVVVAERWVKEIDKAGYSVHGDLEDLVPVAPAGPTRHPDDVDPVAQVESAAAATAELLVDLQRHRDEVARLQSDNARLRRKRKRLRKRLRAATGD
jgi:hypothetical protein